MDTVREQVETLPNDFPYWEEVSENEDQTADVAFTLVEIQAKEQGEDIYLQLENTGDQELSYGDFFRIDYFSEHVWYTVYQPSAYPAVSNLLGIGQKYKVTYTVPPGLFHYSGSYRIYVENLGFCEIKISEG